MRPRIGLIGDSAFAGIRVFNGSSRWRCSTSPTTPRCAVAPSWPRARPSARRPATSLDTLRSARRPVGFGPRHGHRATTIGGHTFDEAVDAIMAEAARQGIPKVMWLTLRTAPVAFVPPDYESTSSTFRDQNLILLQMAAHYGGRLQIADWAGYTASRGSWFASDGIHFQPVGATGAAQYVASQARRVMNGENITPTRNGAPTPTRAVDPSALRDGRHCRWPTCSDC